MPRPKSRIRQNLVLLVEFSDEDAAVLVASGEQIFFPVVAMLRTLINQPDCRALSAQLTRSATNSGLYAAFSSAKRLTDISVDARCLVVRGYRLVRVDQRVCVNGDGFEIALLNDVDGTVAYYNKVRVTVTPAPSPRIVAQCFVWRSPHARHAAAVREIAQNVLFNYIVGRYDVMLSDNQESGEGKFLWQRQASTAIAYGLCVFYLGLAEQLQPIYTQEALNDLIDQLWTETHEQKDHLVLISKPRSNGSLKVSLAQEGQWKEAQNFATEEVTVLDAQVAYDLINNPPEPIPNLLAKGRPICG